MRDKEKALAGKQRSMNQEEMGESRRECWKMRGLNTLASEVLCHFDLFLFHFWIMGPKVKCLFTFFGSLN